MQAGDYGERRSEPWTYSRDEIPHQVFSKRALVKCGKNKPLRPRYRRAKNYFKIADVSRILAKINPKPEESSSDWTQNVINVLREATLRMLDRILFFLPPTVNESLYDWGIAMLDRVFNQVSDTSQKERAVKSAIIYLAQTVSLTVTISK